MSGGVFPEPQDFEAPTLLPVQAEPLTPDDALARFEEGVDRTLSADDLVVVEEDPPPLGRSWAYDFHKRQFLGGPVSHGPLTIRGISTLEQWIEKCLITARGAHPIYSDNFGIDLPADLFGGTTVLFPRDLFIDRVRDALTRHPRITNVDGFAINVDPDEEFVAASFTVHTGQGESFNFQDVRVGG